MELKIRTISYTIIGSGERTGVIDNDILFDDLGFPYIPSKRIKGLLRKSAIEVCSILKIDPMIVENLFGASGFKRSKIVFPNLYVDNYHEMKKEILKLKQDSNTHFIQILTRNNILNYYTSIRQSTAIDDIGVAKKHSLRMFRCIKPDICFTCTLDNTYLRKKEIALLYLACFNLRRIGMKKNRGFGKIECKLSIRDFDINTAINELTTDDEKTDNNSKLKESPCITLKGDTTEKKLLKFKIKTLSPVLIGIQKGDQNTISTLDYIPGTTIRGLLAYKFLDLYGLNSKTAHEDEIFYKLFLDGSVIFNNAYLKKDSFTFHPAPMHLQEVMYPNSNSTTILNFFENETEMEELPKTAPISAFVTVDEKKVTTYRAKKLAYFHHSKNSNMNNSKEGIIFYYEAIAEDEEFEGSIYGDAEKIAVLETIIKNSPYALIGKSKTAQYGHVMLTIEEDSDKIDASYDYTHESSITISALSPILLFSEYGLSSPSIKSLKSYLEEELQYKISRIEPKAKIRPIEYYVGTWKSKSPRMYGFTEGSSFKIYFEHTIENQEISRKLNELEITGIGELTGLGFGQIRIYKNKEKSYTKESWKESNKIMPSSSSILKSLTIIKTILQNEILEIAKHKGFEEAKNAVKKKGNSKDNLSNSLISKLEAIVKSSQSEEEITQKYSDIKNKKTRRSLSGTNISVLMLKPSIIWEDYIKKDLKFRNYSIIAEQLAIDLENKNFVFMIVKSYFMEYFHYLRLFNKKKSVGANNA